MDNFKQNLKCEGGNTKKLLTYIKNNLDMYVSIILKFVNNYDSIFRNYFNENSLKRLLRSASDGYNVENYGYNFAFQINENKKLDIKIIRGEFDEDPERTLEFLFQLDLEGIKCVLQSDDLNFPTPSITSEYYIFKPINREFILKYKEEKNYYNGPSSTNLFAYYFGQEQLSKHLKEKYSHFGLENVPNRYIKYSNKSTNKAEFSMNGSWRYIFTIEGEKNIVQFRINKDNNGEIRIGRTITNRDITKINEFIRKNGYFIKGPDDENKLKSEYTDGKILFKSIKIYDIKDTEMDFDWLSNIIRFAKDNGIKINEDQFKEWIKITENIQQI